MDLQKEYRIINNMNKYNTNNIFTYHAPKPGQQEKYEKLRSTAKELAELILTSTLESREQEQALLKLEESIFWANASIARNE